MHIEASLIVQTPWLLLGKAIYVHENTSWLVTLEEF